MHLLIFKKTVVVKSATNFYRNKFISNDEKRKKVLQFFLNKNKKDLCFTEQQ